MLGIGIDGPLAVNLRVVSHYRTADALLSRGAFRFRGKPGQISLASSQKLHHHATLIAKLALGLERLGYLTIADAVHPNAVNSRCILEVFHNAFLAVLIPEDDFT